MPQFSHCGAAKDALARCDREVQAQEQALAQARQEVERAERCLKDLQETRRELQVTVAEFEAQPEPQYLEPWKHEYVAYQMVGAFRAKYSIQHEPAMVAARLGLRDYVQRARYDRVSVTEESAHQDLDRLVTYMRKHAPWAQPWSF
jgi:chromosome segregation ATPase